MLSNAENPRPTDVTDENWDELSANGFVWLTNLTWPLESGSLSDGDESALALVERWKANLGPEDAKLGFPKNHEGRPDANFCPDFLVGLYVKRSD